MSRTLSMNCGSGDSLNVLDLVRLQPERPPDPADRRSATSRSRRPSTASTNASRPSGCSSSVLTITRSTSSSLIERGLPGRGSSCSPSSAAATNRPRHFPTVLRMTAQARPRSPCSSPPPPPPARSGAQRQRLRRRRSPRPPLEHVTLIVAERHRRGRSSCTSHRLPPSSCDDRDNTTDPPKFRLHQVLPTQDTSTCP